jgi:hypothetical protein
VVNLLAPLRRLCFVGGLWGGAPPLPTFSSFYCSLTNTIKKPHLVIIEP